MRYVRADVVAVARTAEGRGVMGGPVLRCPACRALTTLTTHDGLLVERCERCGRLWPIRTRRNVPLEPDKKGASSLRGPRGGDEDAEA